MNGVSTVTSDNTSSECPECGAGVKVQLEPTREFTLTELTESEVRNGEYFMCPMCEIAWDPNDDTQYEFPVMSSSPNGLLEEVSAGKAVEDTTQSNFRLLGYDDDGNLLLRDVGGLEFARADEFARPEKLEAQLGDVIKVAGSGYPNVIQKTLNALRPCYCINATVGKSPNSDTLEFDGEKPCDIVEAVPVGYAVDTEYIPEFANSVWEEDFTGHAPQGDVPQARRTLQVDGHPAADVYVFPKDLRDEQGVPLIAGMQRGVTHHLEKFTTNFTGAFTDGIIDVIFILPADRPYFAVYCLGGDCIELSHELRAALDLPVVHRGWEANRTQVYDIRYNPQYVERTMRDGSDVLVPKQNNTGMVDIETGNTNGRYFDVTPQPHELVVTVPDQEGQTEVARLRAPTSRVGQGLVNK